MPLMNFTDSSVLNVRASSSASLMTTAGGVPRSRSSSQTAIRRISRSSTAIRSGRQRSAVSAISGSIASSRSTVSRASSVANCRSVVGGGPSSGHCSVEERARGLDRCRARPMSH